MLFKMTKHWNQLKYTELLGNKLWYIHRIDYHGEVKKKRDLFELIWKDSPLRCVNEKSMLHEWCGLT